MDVLIVFSFIVAILILLVAIGLVTYRQRSASAVPQDSPYFHTPLPPSSPLPPELAASVAAVNNRDYERATTPGPALVLAPSRPTQRHLLGRGQRPLFGDPSSHPGHREFQPISPQGRASTQAQTDVDFLTGLLRSDQPATITERPQPPAPEQSAVQPKAEPMLQTAIQRVSGDCHTYQRPAVWVNVPPPLAHKLVGRETIFVHLVEKLCAGHSMAVYTNGLPGVGKRALAIALVYDPKIQAHFSDGLLWAGLGPQPDIISLQNSWATALGADIRHVTEPKQRNEALRNAIGNRRFLLVLDDAWQLEAAQAMHCDNPQVVHLLTTRSRDLAHLFLGMESSLPLSPLEHEASWQLVKMLAPTMCDADPALARRLVQRMNGLPLALRLLAGYLVAPEPDLLPHTPLPVIEELADPRRRLATAEQRLTAAYTPAELVELLVRLTLDELVQLEPAAFDAFYALGTFAVQPAQFDQSAVAFVTEASPHIIAFFINRFLLEVQAGEGLSLPQAIADVARSAIPRGAWVRQVQYCLSIARRSPLNWRDIEMYFSQMAHTWSHLANNDASLLEFVLALSSYFEERGLWQHQLLWANRALVFAQAQGLATERGELLSMIGASYSALGRKQEALSYFEQALNIQRRMDAQSAQAATLNQLGILYSAMGQKREALGYYEQALLLQRKVEDHAGEARTLTNIGMIHAALGDKAQALEYYDQALPLQRKLEDKAGQAVTLISIGLVYAKSDKQRALSYYEQALPLQRLVGDTQGESVVLHNMGGIYAALGERHKALTYYEQAFSLRRKIGDKAGEASTLNSIGAIYLALGKREDALAVYEQSLVLLTQLGDRWHESMLRFNLAILFEQAGSLAAAEAQLVRAVSLSEVVSHPHLANQRAALARIRTLRQRGLTTTQSAAAPRFPA
jgi:tetratricopeptide (TPR) repeat protein